MWVLLAWWRDEEDPSVPRHGHAFQRGMSAWALYDSSRAWWMINVSRAKAIEYAVAIVQGVTGGVWRIDHASWQTAGGHAAFGLPVSEHDLAHDAFVGA